jgi:hypothetical protein
MEKLGLREIEIEMDESEGCIALRFAKDQYAFTLGPTEELTPILSAAASRG